MAWRPDKCSLVVLNGEQYFGPYSKKKANKLAKAASAIGNGARVVFLSHPETLPGLIRHYSRK